MNFDAIRRAVRLKGLTPASIVPEASAGRLEEAAIRPARLVEGEVLRSIPLEPPEAWPGTVGYLDGIQQAEIIGYAGSAPLFGAVLGAAVRQRRDRRLHTVVEARRSVIMGRPSALAAAADAVASLE